MGDEVRVTGFDTMPVFVTLNRHHYSSPLIVTDFWAKM